MFKCAKGLFMFYVNKKWDFETPSIIPLHPHPILVMMQRTASSPLTELHNSCTALISLGIIHK